MSTVIEKSLLENTISYPTYRQLIDDLLAEGKVTGPNQSESLAHYTKMNVARMRRHEKTTKLPESLLSVTSNLSKEIVLLVLTEGWCGDAAQILPVIQIVAETTDKIDIRVLLRDDNLEIMDRYLTNGARSIPIIVGLDSETMQELFVWGPRPKPAAELFASLRAAQTPPAEVAEQLHKWYAKDRSVTLLAEIEVVLAGI